MDLADLDRFQEQWTATATDERITLGVALRGPFRTIPAVYNAEWDGARARGLPITMHCDRCFREKAAGHATSRRCGPKACSGPTADRPRRARYVRRHRRDGRNGTHLSLSPQTEMRTMGFPLVAEMVAAGVLVSLSIDTTGSADQRRHVRADARDALDGDGARTRRAVDLSASAANGYVGRRQGSRLGSKDRFDS